MPGAAAIGIIGNLLSILVFSRRKLIKFCVSILTIVLALSDTLLLTTSFFNIILPGFLNELLSDKSAFWCHFHGYFDLLFASLSGYSIVFISTERWLSVWKPFDKAQYVNFKTTLITVIGYTLISIFAFSWFPLTLNYNPENVISNEICELSRPIVYKIFGTISVIFTYIVPFILLGMLNSLIVYRLHTRQQSSTKHSMIPTSNVSSNDLTTMSSSKRIQRQRNTDRNITLMLITVAIAFMVMSFPYQIYWFYMQIRQMKIPNITLYTLTQTFRYLNCCCNFFLYSATSSLFRRELREIFRCSKLLTNEHSNINTSNNYRTKLLSNLPNDSINQGAIVSQRKNRLSTITKPSSLINENYHLINSLKNHTMPLKTSLNSYLL